MKNKFKIWFLALFSLLILTGCQKPTDPKEAAETLVNAAIYQQDVEKVTEMFVLNEEKAEKNEAADFIKEIETLLPLDENAKTELETVFAAKEASFREQTSFKVNVLKDEKGKAELELKIIGLNALDDDILMEKLAEALDKGLKDITAETTEAEVEELVNQLSYEVLLSGLKVDREVKEAETVKLALMVDAEDKTKWMIQNEDTFMNELMKAFGE